MTHDPNVSALLDEMNRLRGGGNGSNAGAITTGDHIPLRRVLGMRLGSELYGVTIDSVNEIQKLTPITFVPGAPSHILGVTSVRGQIVPVINLRNVLSITGEAGDHTPRKDTGALPGRTLQAKPRIVVVHHDEVMAGLLVDSVTEVYDLRVPLEAPMGGPTRGMQIKEGQVMYGDHMLIILHVPSLFMQLLS